MQELMIPILDIDETCVMVLKYVGPVGYPGYAGSWQYGLAKKNIGERN